MLENSSSHMFVIQKRTAVNRKVVVSVCWPVTNVVVFQWKAVFFGELYKNHMVCDYVLLQRVFVTFIVLFGWVNR